MAAQKIFFSATATALRSTAMAALNHCDRPSPGIVFSAMATALGQLQWPPLPRGPAHGAAAQHMKMKMGHGLPAVGTSIGNQAIA